MLKIAGIFLTGVALLVVLVAASIHGVAHALLGDNTVPSETAMADIPTDYLILYQQAAITCPGLHWSVLAGIGKVETDHGRSHAPGVHAGTNTAGAAGPMQFLLPTFATVVARHPPPPGGARPPSPYNPHDAIYAAAAYLCDNGARGGRNIPGAIFTYNHATWYVAQVLAQAARYRQIAATDGTPGTAALIAVTFARRQLGTPYVWGGDGPNDGGFDCSGLTTAAYAAAGIHLPRTAQAQYDRGPRLPAGTPLAPGDLVFYGTPGHIHHVGIYLGHGLMIDAPHTGAHVRTEPYRRSDYFGATRPASLGAGAKPM
jgi:cell wall-associated NlpC family hydrolase